MVETSIEMNLLSASVPKRWSWIELPVKPQESSRKKSPWESLGKLLTEEEADWGRLREVELVLHRSGGWVGDNQVKGLMIRSKVEGSLQENETACAKAQGINSQRVRREGGGSSAGLPKDSFFPGKRWYHPTPTREKEKRVRKRKGIVEENEKNR